MMNDDMQKTMQFILEQQAQFAVNLQKTEERVARLEEHLAEMARAQTHMNEVVAVMADTHTHTEEKLDAFIGVLERYISSNQNGSASGNGES
ncbi:MAG: hypothetical protein QOF02_349 [Blastocatellia bacterium]|jgi:uncharacterized coiled-coil protein SlyX|nr:hypothetical protein [Blastocatellia bacterium]